MARIELMSDQVQSSIPHQKSKFSLGIEQFYGPRLYTNNPLIRSSRRDDEVNVHSVGLEPFYQTKCLLIAIARHSPYNKGASAIG